MPLRTAWLRRLAMVGFLSLLGCGSSLPASPGTDGGPLVPPADGGSSDGGFAGDGGEADGGGVPDGGALTDGGAATDGGPAADGGPSNPFLGPESRGPYLVGNRSFFFEDSSRDLSCGSGKRILLTEVWYPADPSAASLPENRVEDFLLGRAAEVAAALDGGLEEVNNLPTGSYRDATLRSDAPPLPMLFFSHGFMSNRFQSFTMASYLASHGYLVVAPDHICESKVTLTPTQVVQGSPLQLFTSLPVRVADLRFLVKLFAENTPSPFGGRVDTSRIGLWGHSWGGLTASECIKVETRARALLQIASYGLYGVPPTLRAPSMYFWGKEEKVMSYFRSQHDSFIAAMPRPKYELEFFDTGHFAFSDLCEVIPSFQTNTNGCGTETRASGSGSFTNPPHDTLHAVLNAYATAFFGASFFGLSELRGYLSDNHFPAMMEYRVQR